jgi:diaminopimelate epimerase
MHGCGNDYVYFNCLDTEIKNPERLSVRLSNRRKGIGGDGIILICPSEIADAKMRMFNADGSEGQMCGNGIRCVSKYLYDYGIVKKSDLEIETLSGVKKISLHIKDGKAVMATVDMGKAEFETPVNSPIDIEDFRATRVSMGNPHAVVFLPDSRDLSALDLEKIGPRFEFHKSFPDGVNTEFVKVLDENTLSFRVWERGSGETNSCGTGACAVAVAASLNGISPKNSDILVKTIGGDLIINYSDERVLMTGEAVTVFEGEIDIE